MTSPNDQHASPAEQAAEQPRPLRVLIGADTFSPDVNGAARFAERLAAGLVRRGHDVHIVAPAGSAKFGTWQETHEGQKMTAHRLFSLRWYPHDWLRFAMPWTIRRNAARILDEVKPDVVHFQSHIIVGRGLSIEAEKRGIPMVATNHIMPDNILDFTLIPPKTQEWLVREQWAAATKCFERASAVTTPTRKAAEFLEQYTGLTGVHAISCGIEADTYTPSFEPRTSNTILFVGRVTTEKQIDVLIRALGTLPAELDARLDIVGGGDQRKHLEQLVAQLGLGERVTFLGKVSEKDLRAAYTNAAVFAMPSIAELQSIATMEAMASGLPIVAADAMALPHLVHDGENGYLFTPGSVEELAAKLTTVLTADPVEYRRMQDASLAGVVPHDIERTLTTFEHLYRGEPVTDPVTEQHTKRQTKQPDTAE
ncbi:MULTISPECIES: glycosyltransferase [unclassified Plantibacter]|uniref:glycosyltransferase n=1 Tax=unclassified Plantibacter TaxID=2624265 RepID=UPI003D3578F0